VKPNYVFEKTASRDKFFNGSRSGRTRRRRVEHEMKAMGLTWGIK